MFPVATDAPWLRSVTHWKKSIEHPSEPAGISGVDGPRLSTISTHRDIPPDAKMSASSRTAPLGSHAVIIKRGIVRCPAPRHAWLAIMLEVPTLRKIQVFLQNVNQARTAPSKRSG
jgi:hypothetical protein